MEQHAVPHSVTNFEFKLIGWFTVKQFMYLLLCVGLATVLFFAIPVPILNILMAVLAVLLGIALVFYRYNDRPLDVWIKNLVISLTQPSQYLYNKDNEAPSFLKGVYLSTSAEIAQIHLDASQKLNNYIAQTGSSQTTNPDQDKQAMNTLIHSTPAMAQMGVQTSTPTQNSPTPADMPMTTDQTVTSGTNQVSPLPQTPDQAQVSTQAVPFISGIVRNSKDIALPNIMVYLSTDAGQVVRILKTNHNGIFATFHPLPTGTYILSPKDLSGTYFFDTMSMSVDGPQHEPVQVFSKELL